MGCRVYHVMRWMENLAPPALAADWDRIGLQVGDPDQKVERILLTLTITPEVVEQAVRLSADLIVAHHPLIFRPLTELRWDRPTGALLRSLVTANLAVYAAHTNFDAAAQGTSDMLAERLGLSDTEPLVPEPTGGESFGKTGYGRMGQLQDPMAPEEFLRFVAKQLGVTHLRHNGTLPDKVKRVAVMGGSGASFLNIAVRERVDAYITGDVKFHDALDAQALGLWLIDAGHFGTERWILPFWNEYLTEQARAEGFDLNVTVAEEKDPFNLALSRPDDQA